MALIPENEKHKQQIHAGTIGRKKGHKFEDILAKEINRYSFNSIIPIENNSHLHLGNPAHQLLQYIANANKIEIRSAKAYWLGGLATANKGDLLLDEQGKPITASKSDVLVEINRTEDRKIIGVSVKTCSKKTPTNDQMYFTTARAFCALLERNGIPVSREAAVGMSMFCGDLGYRPIDILDKSKLEKRLSDPRRYYWEELPKEAKSEWENIFSKWQDKITLLLFQKAYKDDPYPPEFLLHQTVKYDDFNHCPTAIFKMDEIVRRSHEYRGYYLKNYSIHKGTYKNDPAVHEAPRFGFIQFQRGGQKQHPTQLQFNLMAGYFKHLHQNIVEE